MHRLTYLGGPQQDMATERLEIQRSGIGKLIKDGNLRVPRNQREYAWKRENVTDLYEDLAQAIRNTEPDYFLGSIVVAKGQDGRLEVFDGQQRLATTIILLAAIRDYFKDTGDDRRASIIAQYLSEGNLVSGEDEPKLILGKIDHDYYLKRIVHSDKQVRDATIATTASHALIDEAAKLAFRQVRNTVAPLPEHAKGQALFALVQYIIEKTMVIYVQVADAGSAYVIFETMNDRGLRPSAADLLKNHIFGVADTRYAEVESSWTTMNGILETVPETEDVAVTFIRHYWISEHGPTRTKDLFDKIKKQVTGRQASVDLATALAVKATLYVALLNPGHPMWNKYGPSASKNVMTLRSLGAEQLRPLLLSAISRFNEEETKRFLTLSVSWAVRFLITGKVGSGALESEYGRRAVDVQQGKIKTCDALAKTMTGIVPGDEEFEFAFARATVAKASLARYYLRALQQKKDGQAEPQYIPNDGEGINLEHVLPEHPSAEWDIDKDVLRANYKRLGNLVLLQASENTLVGSMAYSTKKPILNNSSFSLTKLSGQYEQWTPAEINLRQSELATLAKATWPLNY